MQQLLSPLRLAALATVFASAFALAASDSARADTFTPQNSNPTVSTPSLSASISPDAGQSASQYTYSVTVGDADTLNDLDTVTLCLYHTTAGDATCATPDPATDVKLVWTQSTNAFTIDDGSVNTYWALGTSPAPSAPTLTGVSGIFSFTFFVSEAMRKGGWTAKVTAADGNAGSTDAVDSTPTTTVNGYAAITTRVSQSFGTIASGGSATATASPTVTSNGQTTFSLTAGNFSNGSYSFSLKTATGAPGAGEVAFDCNIGVFDALAAVRIGSTATAVSTAQTASGTAEGGAAVSNGCRLMHGGQRPIAEYAFTVVNSIAIT